MQSIEIIKEKNVYKKDLPNSLENGFDLLSKYRTAIMGFAALWILFSHVWLRVFYSIPFLSHIEEFIKKIGFCGVDIFLFLSGLGLTFSIKKHSTKDFYYNRIKRILLPFLIISIIIRNNI